MSVLESQLCGECPLLPYGRFPCALTPSIYLAKEAKIKEEEEEEKEAKTTKEEEAAKLM